MRGSPFDFARYSSGYRTGVITAPTSEAAPTRWLDWRNQRTRWMKGWMQTWLVHMRSPARLLRELGVRPFLAFHLVFVGMIAGSVMHCLFLAHVIATGVRVAIGAPIGATPDWLLAVDLFNIGAAWIVFAALAARVALGDERGQLFRRLPALWFYWLLVSVASLRAAMQLARAPHLWEKTPHTATDEAPGVPRAGTYRSLNGQAPRVVATSTTSASGRSSPRATSSCHSPAPS